MSLNLGELFATVKVEDNGAAGTLAAVQQGFAAASVQAVAAGAGVEKFEGSLAGVTATSDAAASGMVRAAASASVYQRSLTSTSTAANQLRASQLRATAAQERYEEVLAADDASVRQLATAEAGLITANDRVTASSAKLTAQTRAQILANLEAEKTGTSSFGRIAVAADAAGASSIGAFAGLRSGAASLVKTVVPIQNDYVLAGAAVVAFGALSLDAASKFQTATTRIQTQAGASAAEVKHLSAGMLSLASSVGTLPIQLADAGYHIESVGIRGANALDVLKIAAEGAKLGNADLTDVTNALDAAIVSGIPGVQNYSQAMGALNAIVGAGDMSTQDLADALGTGVLAVIKNYGVTLSQAGAALAVFGDNNIRGAEAGTALRMSIIALTKPTVTGAAALAQLGLTGSDAMTHFAKDLQQGGLTKALGDLNARLVATGNTGAKEGQILTDAFGKKAGVGLAVLIGQYARFQQKLGDVNTGAKTFAADWTNYTKTFGYAASEVEAGAEAAAISLGQRLLPAATAAVGWVGTQGVADLRGFGSELGHVLAAVGPIGPAFSSAGHLAADLISDLKPLAQFAAGLGFGALTAGAHLLGDGLRVAGAGAQLLDDAARDLKPELEAVAIALAAMKVASLVGELGSAGEAMSLLGAKAKGAALSVGDRAGGIGASLLSLASPAGIATATLALVGAELFSMVESSHAAEAAAKSYLSTLSSLDPSKFSSFNALSVAYDAQRSKLQDLAAAYQQAKGSQNNWAQTGTNAAAIQTMSAITGIASSNFEALMDAGKGAQGALNALNASAGAISPTVQALAAQFHMSADAVIAYAQSNNVDLKDGLGVAAAGFSAVIAAQTVAASTAGQLTVATDQLASATVSAADKANILAGQLSSLNGDAGDAAEGENKLILSIHALAGDLDKSSRSLDSNTDAGRTNEDAIIDRLKALDDQAVADEKTRAATETGAQALVDSTAQYKLNYDALVAQAAKLGLNATQVNNVAKALGYLPSQITTKLNVDPAPAVKATQTVASGLKALAASGYTYGADLAQGYADGIDAKAYLSYGASEQMAKMAASAIRKAQVSNSPSKVTAELGGHFGQGYALGIHGSAPLAAAAAGRLTGAAIGALGPAPTLGAGAGGTVDYKPQAVAGASVAGVVQHTVRIIVDNPELQNMIRVEIDGAAADTAIDLSYS